jgi:glutaminase
MQALIEGIHNSLRARTSDVRVADHIPELSKIDKHKLGIAIHTIDGRSFVAGDADEPFSIQSVSKVFTLTLALGKIGDALWARVGREHRNALQLHRSA